MLDGGGGCAGGGVGENKRQHSIADRRRSEMMLSSGRGHAETDLVTFGRVT